MEAQPQLLCDQHAALLPSECPGWEKLYAHPCAAVRSDRATQGATAHPELPGVKSRNAEADQGHCPEVPGRACLAFIGSTSLVWVPRHPPLEPLKLNLCPAAPQNICTHIYLLRPQQPQSWIAEFTEKWIYSASPVQTSVLLPSVPE